MRVEPLRKWTRVAQKNGTEKLKWLENIFGLERSIISFQVPFVMATYLFSHSMSPHGNAVFNEGGPSAVLAPTSSTTQQTAQENEERNPEPPNKVVPMANTRPQISTESKADILQADALGVQELRRFRYFSKYDNVRSSPAF